jgi:anti-sigma regulatory factor (Ser/Thr protein kinase)
VRAPDEIDLEQSFDGDSLYALRASLAAHASRFGAGNEEIEHLLIVASELASNAVRHGGGKGLIRLWHSATAIFCQVTDEGPGFTDPTVGTTLPDPAGRHGGRGIWICRNLTTELIIARGPSDRGATVTATLPAPINSGGHGGS